MKRHHFKLILVPAAILDIRCVDADYTGPDEDYFNEREVEFDPRAWAGRKIYVREIEFSSDSLELLDDISHECALDPGGLQMTGVALKRPMQQPACSQASPTSAQTRVTR